MKKIILSTALIITAIILLIFAKGQQGENNNSLQSEKSAISGKCIKILSENAKEGKKEISDKQYIFFSEYLSIKTFNIDIDVKKKISFFVSREKFRPQSARLYIISDPEESNEIMVL